MWRLLKAFFKREEFDLLAAESSVQGLPLVQQIASGTNLLPTLRVFRWNLRTSRSVSNRHCQGIAANKIYRPICRHLKGVKDS